MQKNSLPDFADFWNNDDKFESKWCFKEFTEQIHQPPFAFKLMVVVPKVCEVRQGRFLHQLLLNFRSLATYVNLFLRSGGFASIAVASLHVLVNWLNNTQNDRH